MPKIAYINKDFRADSMRTIAHARAICEEYASQNYSLTLRQLYYQFVSRDLIQNKDTEYKRLGGIINDARLAGLLDWDYIVDRTRNLETNSHWSSPATLVRDAARAFAMDKWSGQDYRVEVWIEKDALVGVLEACCPAEDVSYFSCRGYTSQSEIWSAAQRLGEYISAETKVIILHLGDHDPSGIDMTRDIRERLATFIAQDVLGELSGMEAWEYEEALGDMLEVRRIALTWEQVQQYNPPPNPAKLTDARAEGYIRRYGGSSWELDALEPRTLVNLIRSHIDAIRDVVMWEEAVELEDTERQVLTATSERWNDVKKFLGY